MFKQLIWKIKMQWIVWKVKLFNLKDEKLEDPIYE